MIRRLLEGAKAIADYLGLQLHAAAKRQGLDRRRRIISLVRDDKLPAFLAGGKWCAYEHEIDGWISAQKDRTAAKLRT